METGLEKREVGGGLAAAAAEEEEEEEERLLMEGIAVLDFDMLCSTVAMQAQKGTWGKLNESNEEEEEAILYRNNENGGGVFRMWEGELIYDCFDDRQIALQSTCCPCYRFGRNMKRAGLVLLSSVLGWLREGSCSVPYLVEEMKIGFFYSILLVIALSNLLAFIITRRRCFLYLTIAFTVLVGTYVGFYRSHIRKKFNIKGSDSSLDDCVYHLICPCCTLSQESRTLEMNNVQDGIWHGRGDTICVGSYSEDHSLRFNKRKRKRKRKRKVKVKVKVKVAVDGGEDVGVYEVDEQWLSGVVFVVGIVVVGTGCGGD
ncbi:PLAC8 family protein [Abeliophyllum distichum]|uniref:PLAC8 family protein n=1 Tax=Abeliophyllum distichum TaxID=126358 RepID=A0ABD1QGT6_9LAMI